MTLSNSLKNVNTMVAMAQVLKKLPLDRIMFVQYPGVTGGTGIYANKVQPDKFEAKALFDKIKADEPFALKAGDTGRGSVADPNAPVTATPAEPVAPSGSPTASGSPGEPSGTPSTDGGLEILNGVQGQSAADYTCSKVNN
ncbi:MAG: LytR family transcriptional regulator, partial [Terrimesophilobacter sp.]